MYNDFLDVRWAWLQTWLQLLGGLRNDDAQSFHGPCLQLLVLCCTCVFFSWECVTPPDVNPTSEYVTARYLAFPCVSTASNNCWSEKAWEPSLENTTFLRKHNNFFKETHL